MDRRMNIINRVVVTLQALEDKGLEANQEALTTEICVEYGCTLRTAKEYYQIAKMKHDGNTKIQD